MGAESGITVRPTAQGPAGGALSGTYPNPAIQNAAGSVSSVSLPANTLSTIQTTAVLAVGTWVLSWNCNILGSAAGTIAITVANGTGTGTLTGQSVGTVTLANGTNVEVSLDFVITVTVAGTFTISGQTSATGAGTTLAGAATGYTATKVA